MSGGDFASADAPEATLTPDDALQPLAGRANFSWSAVGNASYALSQWAIIIVVAQLGSAADVGRFALGLAITAPVVLLSGLQLRAVYATDSRSRFPFADYLSLRLVTSCLALVVIMGFAWLSAGTSEVATVIVMIGIAKVCEGISDAFYGVMQKRERMDRLSISLILRGVLSLVAVALAMLVTGEVVVAAASYAVVGAAILIAYDIPVTRSLLRRGSSESIRPARPGGATLSLAKLAFPLGIVMFLISVNVNIPRYFVEGSLGASALGYFAAIGYLYVGGNTLMVALGESVAPRMSRFYVADRSAYKRLVGRMVLVAFAVGVVALSVTIFFGSALLDILYGPSYADRSHVLVWMMAAAGLGFVSSILSFGLTAARFFAIQVPMFATVALATLLLSWQLIPSMGLDGAAYALLASSALQLVLTGAAFLRALSAPVSQ